MHRRNLCCKVNESPKWFLVMTQLPFGEKKITLNVNHKGLFSGQTFIWEINGNQCCTLRSEENTLYAYVHSCMHSYIFLSAVTR